jgi:protein-disulfide isomerase
MGGKYFMPVLAAASGIVVIVVAILIGSLAGGSSTAKHKIPITDLKPNTMLEGIPQHGNVLGFANAKLTLLEFADPQCSGCQWFSNNVIPELVSTYVRTGKVQMVYEGQTFIDGGSSQDSSRLLRMYLAAGEQNKFWNFAELVYANQGGENSGYATDAYLKAVAAKIPGLNVNEAFSTWRSNTFAATIATYKKHFDSQGFHSTPTLLLGKTGGTTAEEVKGQGNKVPAFADISPAIEAMLKS